MARILRWSAAVAAFTIPAIFIVSAITEPRQSVVFNCRTNVPCDPYFADRAHRWGPTALIVVVLWIVVALVVAATIDHLKAESGA
jgi:hypothetical protein